MEYLFLRSYCAQIKTRDANIRNAILPIVNYRGLNFALTSLWYKIRELDTYLTNNYKG